MATSQNGGVNDVPQGAAEDTLFSIGSDLEGSIGRVECLSALLGRLADDAGDDQDVLILFHLLFSVRAIYREQQEIFHRLHTMATDGRSDGRARS